MPRKNKQMGHRDPHPAHHGLSLIAREPHLMEAFRAESAIAGLYRHLATVGDRLNIPKLHNIAGLSAKFAATLEQLAGTVRSIRHHPKPTRIRLNLLRIRNLEQLIRNADSISQLLADDSVTLEQVLRQLQRLHQLEYDTILKPLSGVMKLAPSGPLYDIYTLLIQRHDQLRAVGMHLPDGLFASGRLHRNTLRSPSPRQPLKNGRPYNGETVRGVNGNSRGIAWNTPGQVERVNLARRSGTLLTDDGVRVFFSARVMADGLAEFASLSCGDEVLISLRKGPLGISATRVESLIAVSG